MSPRVGGSEGLDRHRQEQTVPKAIFFFYGTLMDSDVLAMVTGRPRRSLKVSHAKAEGWRPVQAHGATYPFLVNDPSCRTEGIVVAGVTHRELQRLRRYEGKAYIVGRLIVDVEGLGNVAARVFLPRSGNVSLCGIPWSFETWQRCHKRACMARLNVGEYP